MNIPTCPRCGEPTTECLCDWDEPDPAPEEEE